MPLRKLKGEVACDTETTGLSPWHGDLPYAFSFCDADGETAFIRWRINPWTRQPESNEIDLQHLRRFFGDPKITKVFWNANFDVRMLERIGVLVRGPIREGMFALHVLRTDEQNFRLKRCAKARCDIDDDDEADLRAATIKARRVAKRKGWKIATVRAAGDDVVAADYWLAPWKLLRKYAVLDAVRTSMLWQLTKHALKEEKLWRFYLDVEMALWPVVYEMESRGVVIDQETTKHELAVQSNKAMCALKAIRRVSGRKFNPASPPQLGKLLYQKLRLPVGARTGTGQPSSSWSDLRHLKHPIIQEIAAYRTASKACSTYYQNYLEEARWEPEAKAWVLHPNFQQIGPVTGRFSCRRPNMQNVADDLGTRSALPIQARMCFMPRAGYFWLMADYNQIEIRIFGDIAEDKIMLNALRAGRDLHGETANRVWGGDGNPRAVQAALQALQTADSSRAEDWLRRFDFNIVQAEASIRKRTHRSKAKMLFFGKMYGLGAKSAAPLLDCTIQEAAEILDEYDRAFPSFRPTMEKIGALAVEKGYVETAFGRRIQINRSKSYVATNYYVQGSAADVLKIAMLRVARMFEETGVDARLLLTIHDELVSEWKEESATPALMRRKAIIMEKVGAERFSIELPVDLQLVRKNWAIKEEFPYLWRVEKS